MVAEAAEREGSLASADGTRLHWRSWEVESPAAAVAVVHGLGEHSGRYERLGRALAERGFSVFAVDLRGMGTSAGRRGHVDRWSQWIEDCAAFVELVGKEAPGIEVVPLGHSFGGVLLTSSVLSKAITPERFVLSNPAFRTALKVPGWKLRLGRVASGLVPTLTMSNELDPNLISRDPGRVEAYRSDPLVHHNISSRLFTEWLAASEACLREAAQVRVPFLLILGDGDQIIDHTASLEFERRVTASHTTKVYPGRFHEPFNDLGSDEVFSDLADWLASRP